MPEYTGYEVCARCRGRSDAFGIYETCKDSGVAHEWVPVRRWTVNECADKEPTRPDWLITDETYASWSHAAWSRWHLQCPLWYLWLPDPTKKGVEFPVGFNREDALLTRMTQVEAAGTPYWVQVVRSPDHSLQDMLDEILREGMNTVSEKTNDPAPTTRDPLAPREPFGLGAAMREALKDPVVAQQFADVGNGLAASLQATSRAEAEAAVAPELTVMECLQRVELRVGTVTFAERVPKSNKLLRLLVDLGEANPRQILAGLGKSFEPETMVGRKIVVVANLPPIKMMGLESCGMVLAVGDDASTLSIFQPTGSPRNGLRLS